MAKIQFGMLEFGDNCKYNLYQFSPNENVTVNRQTTQFYNTDGIEVLNQLYDCRIVELRGNIIADSVEEMYKQKRELCKICDGKSTYQLKYDTGYYIYVTEAIADIPKFERNEGTAVEFTINFNVFGFYWLSEIQNFTIGQRTPLIHNSFKLPYTFSQLSQDTEINNEGDSEFPIKVKINIVSGGNTKITLKNSTTNQKIEITYNFDIEDVVEIDTKNCTVTSMKNGNLINYISNDTEFFKITQGINKIEVISENPLISVIEYQNRYVGV